MKPSFEKLVPDVNHSFRCIDRRKLTTPVKWHRHPEIELTYIESGSGSRLVGDHIGEYGNHDLVLLGSNLPHTWASDEFRGRKYDRHSAIVVQFHPDFLGSGFFDIQELDRINEMLQTSNRGLWFPPKVAVEVGIRIKQMMSESGAARLLRLLGCLDVLSESKVAKTLATAAYAGPATVEAESRVRTVCDYIELNFLDPGLSASDLAELLFMNASAFSRFFKQSTGRTPSNYINELRIGYACRQLIDSDKGILAICLDSGFSSTSYFNRSFRKLRGMTPRAYRLEHSRLSDAG